MKIIREVFAESLDFTGFPLCFSDYFSPRIMRDYGEGIPPEEIPHVWERYFTSKQRKSKREHSGLGLAISKEILLAHNAKFGVDSILGQGSCSWFEINATK